MGAHSWNVQTREIINVPEWVSLLSILNLQEKRREASLACSTSSGGGGDVVEASAASIFLRPSPPPFRSQDGEIGIKLPHVAGRKGE